MIRPARSLLALLALALAAGPTLAPAYTGPGHVGRERRELRDDLRDARRAEALLRDFKRTRHSRRANQAVEQRVLAALDRELQEARKEVREQATEVEQDRLKVREDKREGMNTWDHRDPPTIREDRHSLADDRRDLMEEVEYRDRLRVIRVEWHELEGSRSRQAIRRKIELLQEVVRLSHFQIHQAAQEVREGQQELHEGR